MHAIRRGRRGAEPHLVQAPDHKQLLLLLELRGGGVRIRALALRRTASSITKHVVQHVHPRYIFKQVRVVSCWRSGASCASQAWRTPLYALACGGVSVHCCAQGARVGCAT